MPRSTMARFWLRSWLDLINPKKEGVAVDVVSEITLIINQLVAALEEHETRLRLVETAQVRAELVQMESKIRGISDLDKQAKASKALKNLAELFGISDFSDC